MNDLQKLAYSAGQEDVYAQLLGMEKRAVWGQVAAFGGKLLGAGRGLLGKLPGFGKAMAAKGTNMQLGAGMGGAKGGVLNKMLGSSNKFVQGAGKKMQGVIGDTGKMLHGMGTAPLQTMKGGVGNFGRGFMFNKNTTGLAGMAGKATSAGMIGSSLYGLGRGQGQRQLPQQQNPMYR